MPQNDLSESFESYRRDRTRRRLQATGPVRPLGKNAEARKHLEKAREYDPEASEYKVAMGRIYANANDFDKASRLFEEAVARLTSEQRVGNGEEDGVVVGPMISPRQREHVS